MSKHKPKPLHPATIRHVEEITGKPVTEDYANAIAATFTEPETGVVNHEAAVSRRLREPSDADAEAVLQQIAAKRRLTERMREPQEEYSTGEVGSFAFLQAALNEAAEEGRWRLHTAEITSATCRYVLVRAYLG